jgi:hypothetical protein
MADDRRRNERPRRRQRALAEFFVDEDDPATWRPRIGAAGVATGAGAGAGAGFGGLRETAGAGAADEDDDYDDDDVGFGVGAGSAVQGSGSAVGSDPFGSLTMEDKQNVVGVYLREVYNMLGPVVYRDMEDRLRIMESIREIIQQTTGSVPAPVNEPSDHPTWMSQPSDVDRMIAVLTKVQERIAKLYMFAMHQELEDLAPRLYRLEIMLRILLGDDDIPEAGRDGMITPPEGERLLNPRNLDMSDEEAKQRAEASAAALDQDQFRNLSREVALVEQAANEWRQSHEGEYDQDQDDEQDEDDDEDEEDFWAPARSRRRTQ